jgi:hypothetical protein
VGDAVADGQHLDDERHDDPAGSRLHRLQVI